MDHVLACESNPASIKHLSKPTSRLLEIPTGYGAWEWNIVSGEVQWFGMHERSAGSWDERDHDHIQSFTDMLHPDDRVRVWQKLNSSMARREIPYADEYRVMHPDGSVRWISGTGRFYYDGVGKPVRMTGVMQGITERKQTEAKLHESEERLRLAQSTANIGATKRKHAEQALRENEAWQSGQKEAFQAAMNGASLEDSLRPLVRTAVRYFGGDARAAFYRVRDDGATLGHVVGMSEAYARSVEGFKIGKDSLSCGLAMYQVAAVITPDITQDPRWRPWLWLAQEHRFRTCWSFPVRATDGPALGTLALYFNEPRQPTARALELVDVLTHAATIIISRHQESSERARVEHILRESEARFRTMAETVPSMLFETDAAGLNTWTSEDWCRFTGQTPEQVARHGWAEALHPDDREVNLSQWLRCMETGRNFESQQRLRRTDGSYTWVIAQALPVRDEEGTVRRWVGSVTNIDVIMRAEEERARLAAIVENTSDAIIGKDLQGTITSWNRAAETLLGYRAAEVIGRSVTVLFPPDRLEEESAILGRLWKGESIRQYETVRRCKDGRDISVSLTISLVRDKHGRIIGASKILRDISERKQTETKLRESEAQFRNVFEHAGTGIVIVNLDGNFVQCNPAYCAMLGYAEDELLQVHFSALVHVEDRDVNLAETKRLLTGELPYFEIENRYVHKNGESVWVRKFISLLRDDEGRPMYGLALVTDITERRKTEQELLHAKEHLQRWAVELEKAVKEKTSELVQSQTRLRSLAGELSLAEQRERKRLAGELHDHLQQLLVLGKLTVGQGKRSAGRPGCDIALNRVDDILSEALTYSRTLVTELSPPVLRDHGLAAGLQWLGAYMKKHGQTVTVKVPGEKKEVQLPEDQVILLFQSVRELLINSSKHAGTGHATVTMELVDGDLRIIVSDDGAGFDLAAVAAGPHPSGGISSKFGLFSIEERMLSFGGRFDLYSTPGQGTTATLLLPLT